MKRLICLLGLLLFTGCPWHLIGPPVHENQAWQAFVDPLYDTALVRHWWAVGGHITGWTGCTDARYYPQFQGTGALDDKTFPPADLGVYHVRSEATAPICDGLGVSPCYYARVAWAGEPPAALEAPVYQRLGMPAYFNDDTETTTGYYPNLYWGCNTQAHLSAGEVSDTGGVLAPSFSCIAYWSGYHVLPEEQGNPNSTKVFSYAPISPSQPAVIQWEMHLTASLSALQWTGSGTLTFLPPWPACEVTYGVIAAIPVYF